MKITSFSDFLTKKHPEEKSEFFKKASDMDIGEILDMNVIDAYTLLEVEVKGRFMLQGGYLPFVKKEEARQEGLYLQKFFQSLQREFPELKELS